MASEPKRSYDSDRLMLKDVYYTLTVIKRGKRDSNFDGIIDDLLTKLDKPGIICKNGPTGIATNLDEFIEYTDNLCIFQCSFPHSKVTDFQRKIVSQTKAELQQKIKENKRYNDICVYGKYDYKFEVSSIPVDLPFLLFELNQQIQGLRINIYETKEGKKLDDALINTFNKTANVPWEVVIQCHFVSTSLGGDFYSKLQKISTFLIETSLLDNPLDSADIKRRYSEAMKEVIAAYRSKPALQKLSKSLGKTEKETENLVGHFVEYDVPKIYHFTLDLKRISPEKFVEIQEKLGKELMLPGFSNKMDILLTTNADTTKLGYGCFIETRPDAIK